MWTNRQVVSRLYAMLTLAKITNLLTSILFYFLDILTLIPKMYFNIICNILALQFVFSLKNCISVSFSTFSVFRDIPTLMCIKLMCIMTKKLFSHAWLSSSPSSSSSSGDVIFPTSPHSIPLFLLPADFSQTNLFPFVVINRRENTKRGCVRAQRRERERSRKAAMNTMYDVDGSLLFCVSTAEVTPSIRGAKAAHDSGIWTSFIH